MYVKSFIAYHPDDDPLAPKHVAVKSPKIRLC